MWIPKGKRPIVTVTGSHQKTCIFGTLTINGKQLFRQYKTFDQHSFISYLQELKRKFHKLVLFLDRAPPQYYNIVVPLVFLEVSRHDFMKIVDKDVKTLTIAIKY